MKRNQRPRNTQEQKVGEAVGLKVSGSFYSDTTNEKQKTINVAPSQVVSLARLVGMVGGAVTFCLDTHHLEKEVPNRRSGLIEDAWGRDYYKLEVYS